MPRVNKYIYENVIQTDYGYGYGFEDTCAEETYLEGRKQLRVYRREQPQYRHRLIERRTPNPEFQS